VAMQDFTDTSIEPGPVWPVTFQSRQPVIRAAPSLRLSLSSRTTCPVCKLIHSGWIGITFIADRFDFLLEYWFDFFRDPS
jgi:hypothetical protein